MAGGRRLLILRPYQQSAFDTIWNALQYDLSVLLEAACSAGKTLIFSKIIQKLLAENPDFRALILTDREILVNQTREKLSIVAPELLLETGICCASVNDIKELEKRVTIASRQSLLGQLNDFPSVNLIVIDECHLVAVPQIGQVEPADQFGTIIETLRNYNPNTRLLGVTATPYRLGDGYIYGGKNKPGSNPLFQQLHHKITTKELLKLEWLSPLIGKTVLDSSMTVDLAGVSLVAGEYNLGKLSDMMINTRHIQSAVDTWLEYAKDRNKTIAYCVTINHAEKLKDACISAGIPALTVHSQLSDIEEDTARKELADPGSAVKIFCSVAQLTMGLDVPSVDCILMARATKSAALYKQILGRGQRLFPGKENCLVLDLVGNNNEFGTDLDKLRINYQAAVKDENGRPLNKLCPNCDTELHPAVRVCPECDYSFAEEFKHADKPEMTDVEYGEQKPKTLSVIDMIPELHISKSNGRTLLRVRLELELSSLQYKTADIWLCFPGDGYEGYAVSQGRKWWKKLTNGDTEWPENAEEALTAGEVMFMPPATAKVSLSGKYPKVLDVYGDNLKLHELNLELQKMEVKEVPF